tara:strand:- start:70 stop:1083 length:1014 start_codon:yes stop_codon:yes gene_type:complete
MQVAQRGTSETGVTSGQYADAPDRFKVEMSSAGTWTVSQSTTAPSGFSYSYKFDCTTADASLGAGDYLQLSHYLEGQDLQHLKKGTSDAEKVTLSFYVRSNKTGTYIVEFYDADNARSISKSYTISSANTFERKTITIDGDTTGAFGNDNGGSLGIFFYLGAGSNFTSGTLNTSWGSRTLANVAVGQVNLADSTDNEWYITGVQLEVGEQATPFEHRSFGEELALCQRYFYNHVSNSTGAIVGNGDFFSASQTTCLINFPVSMRATPSMITENGGTNYYSIYSASVEHTVSNAWALFLPQVNCANLYITPNSNGTSGNATRVRTNNASAFIYFDSEL